MSTTSSYKIEKLRGPENYTIWSFKTERILQEKLGSYNILSEDPVNDPGGDNEELRKDYVKYKAQDEIAITTMTLSMQDQILNHVMHLKNAKAIWDHLKNKYNRADTYSITALRRSLYVSTKGTKDIAKFLSEIKSIRNQLANINVVISDA